jgi:squalene synthase HpnC
VRAGGRDLRDLESRENFPVALRLLPADVRGHLRAIYDTVRTIDDLSDETRGDATAALEAFRADLARLWQDGPGPSSPVLVRLAPTVRDLDLPDTAFTGLIEAGLQDQRVSGYASFADLRDYCRLSADPVGRLVLATFRVADPEAVELSDRICTALQLLEHWQDVAEDRRKGRIYLPVEDMERFGVRPEDLDAPTAGRPLRALLRFETQRALDLLRSGSPLVGRLRGHARIAVSGYVAGGLATVDALDRCAYDSLRATPRPRKRRVVRHALSVLARGR